MDQDFTAVALLKHFLIGKISDDRFLISSSISPLGLLRAKSSQGPRGDHLANPNHSIWAQMDFRNHHRDNSPFVLVSMPISRCVAEKYDIYDGEPWTEMDLLDLTAALKYGDTIEEAATHLCCRDIWQDHLIMACIWSPSVSSLASWPRLATRLSRSRAEGD
jgi:hypothetical protein